MMLAGEHETYKKNNFLRLHINMTKYATICRKMHQKLTDFSASSVDTWVSLSLHKMINLNVAMQHKRYCTE